MKKLLPVFLSCLLMTAICFAGCGRKEVSYDSIYEREVLSVLTEDSPVVTRLPAKSEGFCVVDGKRDFDPNYITASFAGVFADDGSGELLYEKNALERMYPASLTKCMTALLVLEYAEDLDTVVKTGDMSLYGLSSSSSSADLQSFSEYTVRDLLTGLLVPSGNDAALVLSEYVAGTTEAFVKKMNEKALALGMVDTHFTNPHGLFDKNHYTTVYDLYLLMHACMQYREFIDIAGAPFLSIYPKLSDGSVREQRYVSSNSYLKNYTIPPEGVKLLAVKTGYTVSAGRCLIFAGEYAERRFIAVIGHAASYDLVYEEMNRLLNLTVRLAPDE